MPPTQSPARSPTARTSSIPPGFRAPPRPKPRPIDELSVRELRDLLEKNARTLASPSASTSTYFERLTAEQVAIESQLVELEGVQTIDTGMKHVKIQEDNNMNVDLPPELPVPMILQAKRKALANYVPSKQTTGIATMDLSEAMELERQAHLHDLERQKRLETKRYPVYNENLTRAEREARIWAFMNHKPTDSDLEDDSDHEDSDDDPANWFEDDQDDGRKGQDIIEPDEYDYSNVIRVDHDAIHYNAFYEPRDDGD